MVGLLLGSKLDAGVAAILGLLLGVVVGTVVGLYVGLILDEMVGLLVCDLVWFVNDIGAHKHSSAVSNWQISEEHCRMSTRNCVYIWHTNYYQHLKHQ